MISGIDHIQLAMPTGQEDKARAFYLHVLKLREIPKPEVLATRGGVWFALPDKRQLHLGVEEKFAPAKKAHPAFVCDNLDDLAQRLTDADFPVNWDTALAPRRRFYSADPFGNRIEFLALLDL